MSNRPDLLKESLHPQGPTAQVQSLKQDVAKLQRSPTPLPPQPPAYASLLRLGIRQIQQAYLENAAALTTSMATVGNLTVSLQSGGGLCLVFWNASVEMIQTGAGAGDVIVDINIVYNSAIWVEQRCQIYTELSGIITLPVSGVFLVPISGSGTHTFSIQADRISGASAGFVAGAGDRACSLIVIELDADPGMMYIANQTPPAPRS